MTPEAKPPASGARVAGCATIAAALAILGLGACGSGGGGGEPALPRGDEPVELDPTDFSVAIDNPYWPMTPGTRWVYREVEGDAVMRVEVTVTARTKMTAAGIPARVVRDVVTERGTKVEVTDDWYAQDSDGNVWYLGEDTAEYEDGKPTTTAGSFEAGVDGAEAGIAMPADPRVGLRYRQEYYEGEAEDEATVLSLDERVEVPFDRYTGVLMTKDLDPLEPAVNEHKFYARGVGPVLTLNLSGGVGREELVDYVRD
ncbi:MAG TPA: hypothetical protein VK919_08140 [Solirubrobacterales bacterium]|nr:hypothetical protein [Solirubrobacterales bacterium]